MSESVRLLRADSNSEMLDVETISSLRCIDGETDALALDDVDLSVTQLVVEFNGVADGRGFSLLKALRDAGYGGQLYAAGYINPDQLSLAFQTGFDGVLVSQDRWDDYGEAAWESALSPVVSLSYAVTDSPRHRSIWQTRHSN